MVMSLLATCRAFDGQRDERPRSDHPEEFMPERFEYSSGKAVLRTVPLIRNCFLFRNIRLSNPHFGLTHNPSCLQACCSANHYDIYPAAKTLLL
jgi:hypothetical protein